LRPAHERGRARSLLPICTAEGCGDADPRRPVRARAQGPAGQAPPRPQIHAGKIRLSRRPRRSGRPAHAGGARARSPRRSAPDEAAQATERGQGVRGETTKAPRGPWTEFAAANILPDLGALHFIGRAITPPGRPRRFDARFFTMDAGAIAHRIEGVTGPDAELVELVWMPLGDAKELDMPAVTGVMLEELDARIADGFAPELPVPFYSMPRGRFKRELL